MNVFARQEIIRGWSQPAIHDSRVLVNGRNWCGCFAVWGLTSLGVAEVVWLGASVPAPARFAAFLAGDLAPGLGASLLDYPLEPQQPEEVGWILASQPVRMMVNCDTGGSRESLAALAAQLKVPFLDVSCAAHSLAPGGAASGSGDPVPAMLAAALAVDEFRHLVNPIEPEAGRELGRAEVASASPAEPGPVLVVGAGGIGVYCAALLAALGVPLALVDFDTVEPSNLNRQGLFTAADADAARPKAAAAAARLRELFPGCPVCSDVARIGRRSQARVRSLAPAAIVSAVDNAAARLALSAIGERLRVPVVQAGTGVFSADCYVQSPGGLPLDEQMRGALSAAAETEGRRQGSCAATPSYIVPGMVAGAFAAARAMAVLAGAAGLPSLHWRSGILPRERREIRDEFAAPSV